MGPALRQKDKLTDGGSCPQGSYLPNSAALETITKPGPSTGQAAHGDLCDGVPLSGLICWSHPTSLLSTSASLTIK